MLWVRSVSSFLYTIFLMLSSSHRPPFSVFWLERKGFSFPAPLSTSHSCDCLQGQVVRGGQNKISASLSMLLESQSPSTKGFISHLAANVIAASTTTELHGIRAGGNGKKQTKNKRLSFSIPSPTHRMPFPAPQARMSGLTLDLFLFGQGPLPGLGLPLSLGWKACN